jgi:hypothetical protein
LKKPTQWFGNTGSFALGTLIVILMISYFLYAVREKGIWAGVFVVFVSFVALLYHLAQSKGK